MNVVRSLNHFIDSTPSEHMPDAASHLIELLEADEVEPLGSPGRTVLAEDLADRLEERLRRHAERAASDEMELIEDAVAQLRANEGSALAPWSFEDGEGVRWFVLADEGGEVVACYSSAAFQNGD